MIQPPSGAHGAGAPSAAELTGAVLCGGASSRMGRDKAHIEWDGRSLLARAEDALRGACGRVLLACGPVERYAERGLPLVLDRFPGRGPLAGLHAALAASESEWLACLACDMPRARAELVTALFERARERDLDACLLETDAGREPLYAVYRKSCLVPVERALARGERRMVAFHDDVRVGTLHQRELDPEMRAAGCASNVNTPDELRLELEREGSVG